VELRQGVTVDVVFDRPGTHRLIVWKKRPALGGVLQKEGLTAIERPFAL
jgi:hypothetical protein